MYSPSILGELKPQKRRGHISVFYKGLFVVFGGYNAELDVEKDDYLKSSDLWCYSIEASRWTRYNTNGQHPVHLSGACATLIGDDIYLFGGFQADSDYTNKLHTLNLKTLTWTDEDIEGSPPSPRDKLGCWQYEKNVIYFGGFGPPPQQGTQGDFFEFDDITFSVVGWNNQLYVLDTSDKLKWRQPKWYGDVPSPRAAFACAQIKQNGYLFGGRFDNIRTNDLYHIDLRTYTWNKLETPKVAPCGRTWHVLSPVSTNHLFLYGGMDSQGDILNDVWIYDILKQKWTELKHALNYMECPTERLWHSACSTNCHGEIVIFGGFTTGDFLNNDNDMNSYCNNLNIFRYSPLPLRRLCLYAIISFQLGDDVDVEMQEMQEK